MRSEPRPIPAKAAPVTGSPVLARVNQSAALSRMAARHRQICGRAGEKAAAEREIDAGLLDRPRAAPRWRRGNAGRRRRT
jgi:hypothetical protein